MRKMIDLQGNTVVVGEVFVDRAGNECYYRENGSLCVRSVNKEASRTIQSERDKVDIHKILDKFARTGVMGNVRSDQPVYGDFSSAVDYMESQTLLTRANNAFQSLDSSIRKRFHHDPVQMLQFLDDPANRDEAIKLGLIQASPASPQDNLEIPQGEVSGETPTGK